MENFSQANFGAVDSALSSLLYAGDFMTCADPRAWIRKSNALLDACIDAGMPRDRDDHAAWAAEYVINMLVAA